MAAPRFPTPAGVAAALSSMRDTLLNAAYNGDLPLLKRLVTVLDNGRGRPREAVDAARSDGGVSALLVAAGNEQMEVCIYLVEALRVDVNAADDEGRTPLLYAATCEKAAVVKYLLDHGADPNKADNNELTPLHSAAGIGDCEMIELLLAKGAYIDPIADEIGTPLHLATKEQQVGAMKTLLDHNADCNKPHMIYGLYPMTPLFQAVNVSSVKCVKLLVEAGAVINSDCIQTVLLDSAMGNDGSTECLNFLLEADAKRNASNGEADHASTRGGVNGPAPRSGRGRGRGQGQQRRRKQHAVRREEFEVKVDLKNEQANKRKIEQLKSFASKAIERKYYISASAFYTKAIDVDPNDATLFSNRSLCWLRTGDGPKALLDALGCREMRPDWPKACYRQVTALMLLKDYESACKALLDGFKFDPENGEMESALWEAMESLKVSKGDTKAA